MHVYVLEHVQKWRSVAILVKGGLMIHEKSLKLKHHSDQGHQQWRLELTVLATNPRTIKYLTPTGYP